jgi:flagellar motor switch protein FliG
MKTTSLQAENLPPHAVLHHLQVLRRIAMFVMELGVQVSADVMNGLSPEELGQIAEAIADLEVIDPFGAHEAFQEFQSMKAKGAAFAKLGSDYALHFVREALRSEAQRRPVDVSRRSGSLLSIDQSATHESGTVRG